MWKLYEYVLLSKISISVVQNSFSQHYFFPAFKDIFIHQKVISFIWVILLAVFLTTKLDLWFYLIAKVTKENSIIFQVFLLFLIYMFLLCYLKSMSKAWKVVPKGRTPKSRRSRKLFASSVQGSITSLKVKYITSPDLWENPKVTLSC